jgi:hypothetical protein
MDIFDKAALAGRRYEQRRTHRTGARRFELRDLLETYAGEAILQMRATGKTRRAETTHPDSERKLKLSLLDSISDLGLPTDAWFQVSQTAPTGDLSKVRITAHDRGSNELGTIEMLLGRRSYDYYFHEDPLLANAAVQPA